MRFGIGKTGGRFVDWHKGVVMSITDHKDEKPTCFKFIPEIWKVDRLRDVTIINEYTLSANTDPNHEIRYIDISNVNVTGIVSFDEIKKLTFEESPSRARRIVNRGDTIISSVRTNLQAVAYIDFYSDNFIASTGFFVCHAKFTEIVFPKFLYWFLLTNYSKDYFFSRSIGVSYPAIDDYKFSSIPMPLPPAKEQKTIADYLDKACQNIDKTITLKQQQLEKLEAYRKSVIHEAVTKGLDKTVPMKYSGVDWLGEIPAHWNIDRLKDVSSLRDEKTATKSSDENYLELEDIGQWTGKILNKRNTLEVASQVNIFYKGDVLFGKLRPYLAKYAHVNFDGKCTGEILAIEPIRVYGGYLAYYVGSKHFINHCDNFSYGAKMPRINWSTQMGTFPIPIPPLFVEQKFIADYLDKASQGIDKTKEIILNQIKILTQYRLSLIHECVTGKKRIYQGD